MKFLCYPALVLGCCFLGACAYVNVPLVNQNRPLEEQVLEGEGKGKILLIDVAGFISEKEKSGSILSQASPSMISEIRESLNKAERDDDVRAVIIRINSPGGTVTASDVIHHDLLSFKKRKNIPVAACIMSLGTSGAYYIATAADEIVAHPTSVTGSIGVIVMKFNVEGLMGKIGITEQSIKSGDKKDILSPFRPATTEEQRLMQEIIDELHRRFVQVVLARPGNILSPKEFQTLADGRVFTAEKARAAGLVDKVGYLDDVIEGIKNRLGMNKMRIVTYHKPGSYKGSLYAAGPVAASSLSAVADFLGAEMTGESNFMYLWRP